MEPETSTPKFGPEQAPVQYGPNVERAPQPDTPERVLEAGAERHEQVSEMAARASDASSLTTVALPTPIAQDDATNDDVSGLTTPVTANDDDLIEKEWVDRAKKIVADTKSDPYGQEKEVNQLQKEYLKKRYGRELGGAQ